MSSASAGPSLSTAQDAAGRHLHRRPQNENRRAGGLLLLVLILAVALAGAVYLDWLAHHERFSGAAWWAWLW